MGLRGHLRLFLAPSRKGEIKAGDRQRVLSCMEGAQ